MPDAQGATDVTPHWVDAGADAAPGPEVLSQKAEHALAIAVDSTHVYWTNNEGGGSVMACEKTSCASTVTILGGGVPWGIVADGTNVYWTDESGGVWTSPASGDGGNPKLLSPSKYPTQIAVRAGLVYWTDQLDCAIYACPTTGCTTPTTIAKEPSSVSMNGIAVDGTTVYWTLDHSIHACPITGCASPTTIVDVPAIAGGLAVDSTNLYWATAPGALIECALGAWDGGESLLASAIGNFATIAVDETNVYWTDWGDGKVLECPIAGCAQHPRIIASGQNAPYGIAIDATSVYWVNMLGYTVMRAPK